MDDQEVIDLDRFVFWMAGSGFIGFFISASLAPVVPLVLLGIASASSLMLCTRARARLRGRQNDLKMDSFFGNALFMCLFGSLVYLVYGILFNVTALHP